MISPRRIAPTVVNIKGVDRDIVVKVSPNEYCATSWGGDATDVLVTNFLQSPYGLDVNPKPQVKTQRVPGDTGLLVLEVPSGTQLTTENFGGKITVSGGCNPGVYRGNIDKMVL